MDGNAVGTYEMPCLCHPYPYHYGRNWRVPGGGNYSLLVRGAPIASERRRRAWMGRRGRSRFFWSPCKPSGIRTGKSEALRELKIELRQEVGHCPKNAHAH